MAETKFDFNKAFAGDYSGLLNDNTYARNVRNNMMLENSPTSSNQSLMSPTQPSFAPTQPKDRTLLDRLLKRENPENVQMRKARDRAMLQDYMYNQIDNDADRLLFSLDPNNWISQHQSNKFKDKNREGYHNGRPYVLNRATGRLHYMDGAQEPVFNDGLEVSGDNEHSTIKLFNEYNKVRKYKVDANGNETTELNENHNPQLANYLLSQLEALGENDDFPLIVNKVNPDGSVSTTIGGENTSGAASQEKGLIMLNKSGGDGLGDSWLMPMDIQSYFEDPKYAREFEASYQSDQVKALKMQNIMNDIDDIGIDYITTIPAAANRLAYNAMLKMGGEDFFKQFVGTENADKYEKSVTIIQEQTGMLNAYIKEITGAQMSEKEVVRLVQALANLGVTGDLGRVFGAGDNPVAFKAKFDVVMKHIQEARARRYFYFKNADIQNTLKNEYPGLEGIDYAKESRFLEQDIMILSNETGGNLEGEYRNPKTGEIEKYNNQYATNSEYYMDDFRIRDLMSSVQEYNLEKSRKQFYADKGMSREEFLNILNDEGHPQFEEYNYLEKGFQLKAIQDRNELFGLGKNELTMNQRSQFEGFDQWENRKKGSGNYYSVNLEGIEI